MRPPPVSNHFVVPQGWSLTRELTVFGINSLVFLRCIGIPLPPSKKKAGPDSSRVGGGGDHLIFSSLYYAIPHYLIII